MILNADWLIFPFFTFSTENGGKIGYIKVHPQVSDINILANEHLYSLVRMVCNITVYHMVSTWVIRFRDIDRSWITILLDEILTLWKAMIIGYKRIYKSLIIERAFSRL